jgi:spore germination cell wall hydrolase CwlJ-like protein
MTPLLCLTLVVYFEARGELAQDNSAGYAVAEVVMNRVASPRFPNTVCEVIKQHREGSGPRSCQFSFYCDGLVEEMKEESAAKESRLIAADVLAGRNLLGIEADHYHTTSVSPSWSTSMELVGKVGSHLFYKQN